MDGVLLVVVRGDGTVVVPVDVTSRRPDPHGPGGPCRVTLPGVQTRLDARLAALERGGLALPAPVAGAARWWRDAQLLWLVHRQPAGLLLVEGTRADVGALPDGRRVKGCDFLTPSEWAWRAHPWAPGVHDARQRAQRPTSGAVPGVIVDEPGQERLSLRGLDTTMSAPQLLRRWRHGSALVLRTLTPLLATAAWQVSSADAYSGPLVVRLRASCVVFSPARVLCKGRLTMAESGLSLKHSWRFVDSEGWHDTDFHGVVRRKSHEYRPKSSYGKVRLLSPFI